MATNIINNGNAITTSGIPVYYNTSYSSAGMSTLTFQIYGPGAIGEYNPAGTAFVQYYDPLTGQTTVETFYIGGQIGPSEITIQTGNLYDGATIGQVSMTFVDAQNIPGAGPGFKFLGSLGKVLKSLGYVGNSIDGVFGVPGYNVSLLANDTKSIEFNLTYPPGYLESLGITPGNLPAWIVPEFDGMGNFIGMDYQSCFLAGTMISMWPIDPGLKPDANGIYDEKEVLAKAWEKPIEEVTPDEWVLSYDGQKNLQPGKVSRIFQNQARHILDVFGLMVTPGHATLCGDGRFAGKHVPIIDILRSDGALVKDDGSMIRANTGCKIGSYEDRFVRLAIGRMDDTGNLDVSDQGTLRIGSRLILEDGRDISIGDILDAAGARVTEDGRVASPGMADASPLHLTFLASLPQPEDYILRRSGLSLREIYEANEWEDMAPPQLPAPVLLDHGPVRPIPAHQQDRLPRNEPISFAAGAAATGPELKRAVRASIHDADGTSGHRTMH